MKKQKIKTIGVMTGGGDCPGLNAVIRAVAKAAMAKYGLEVWGIEDGYLGLIENRMRQLRSADVSGILTVGGTILGTSNTSDPFRFAIRKNGTTKYADVSAKCIEHLRGRGIDALFCIGGDGTMASAAKFAKMGLPVMGIPKTIDNDLVGTDVTFGFNTAVTTATEAIDKLHTTASSHHRIMIVEVMGRYAGWIALYAGMAGGADVILLPEMPYRLDKIEQCVRERAHHGKCFSIICVAEGAKEKGGQFVVGQRVKGSPDPIRLGGIANKLQYDIQKLTGLEARAVILGHTQRGGTPTPYDRVLATNFGYKAISLLMEDGVENHLVVFKNNEYTSISLSKVAGKIKNVPKDHPLIKAALAIKTSFGA
jgi:ATP-dependent phosphofructokinase / diphosphate-dependent phosphofructokinase